MDNKKTTDSKIDVSSPGKFYETYRQYYLNTVTFNTSDSKLQYVFYCRDSNEIFCIEGYSMEQIYYTILFTINYNCCDDIYVYEYPIKKLKDPIKLIREHYFDSEYYVFEKINFITSDLISYADIDLDLDSDSESNIDNIINMSSPEEFYETYKQYYRDTVKFNKQQNKLQYVFISHEYAELYFVEGYSMEEIYYIILFIIKHNCWEEIYNGDYLMEQLTNPIELFKTIYFGPYNNSYSFENVTNSMISN